MALGLDMPAELTTEQDQQPPEVANGAEPRVSARVTLPVGFVTLDELDRRHILAVLEACDGNKSAAARVLGISVRSVYRWLHRLGAM